MYCKWCGMDSKNEERCEWCGKLLAQPAGAPAPQSAPTPGRAPESSPGTVPPTTATALSPGLPTAAVTPEMVRHAVEDPGPPLSYRFEHALALICPILLVSLVLGHFAPRFFSLVLLVDLFLVGLLLAVTGYIKYFDDEYADVGAVLVVALMLGTQIGWLLGGAIALGGYLVLGLIRGEQNRSLVTLMGAYLGTMLLMTFALQGVRGGLSTIVMAEVGLVLNLLALCAILAGWIMSGFWRPLNA